MVRSRVHPFFAVATSKNKSAPSEPNFRNLPRQYRNVRHTEHNIIINISGRKRSQIIHVVKYGEWELFMALKVVATRLLIYRQKVVIYMIVLVRTCRISRVYIVFNVSVRFGSHFNGLNLLIFPANRGKKNKRPNYSNIYYRRRRRRTHTQKFSNNFPRYFILERRKARDSSEKRLLLLLWPKFLAFMPSRFDIRESTPRNFLNGKLLYTHIKL